MKQWEKNPIQTNPFGTALQVVTRVGLSGEGVLRTTGRFEEAGEVIDDACLQGITYFDSARVYSDSELYYDRKWKSD